MLWALNWVAVLAVPYVVRVGSVDDPALSVRFGPKRDVYDCEVKPAEVDLRRLAIKSRWALLSRHCKSFVVEKWNYQLCFGGLMTRFQYGGHARISLGVYDEKRDSYAENYFVQHYVNGTRLVGTDQNRTAEVRCFCGKKEPTILSVDYDNHTVVSVEMPSCCRKVEFEAVLNAFPRLLSFDSKTGQNDYRFPGTSVQSVRIEFSRRKLALYASGSERHEFKIGEPRFLSHVPAIALGPLAPRGTLRSNMNPALLFPVTRAQNKASAFNYEDDFLGSVTFHVHERVVIDGKEQDVVTDVAPKKITEGTTKDGSNAGVDDKSAFEVKGGIFCVCQEQWNTNFGEELMILRQVRYLAGGIPEVYVIIESLAFCAFHQLLPLPTAETAIQCQPKDPKKTSRMWF